MFPVCSYDFRTFWCLYVVLWGGLIFHYPEAVEYRNNQLGEKMTFVKKVYRINWHKHRIRNTWFMFTHLINCQWYHSPHSKLAFPPWFPVIVLYLIWYFLEELSLCFCFWNLWTWEFYSQKFWEKFQIHSGSKNLTKQLQLSMFWLLKQRQEISNDHLCIGSSSCGFLKVLNLMQLICFEMPHSGSGWHLMLLDLDIGWYLSLQGTSHNLRFWADPNEPSEHFSWVLSTTSDLMSRY